MRTDIEVLKACLRTHVQAVRQDIQKGSVMCIRENGDLPMEVWDAVFDACSDEVKFKHVTSIKLKEPSLKKHMHVIVFFKDKAYLEEVTDVVKKIEEEMKA